MRPGPTIAMVEAIPVRLKLITEVPSAVGRIPTTEQAIIHLTDSDGVVGMAEAVARPYVYGETIESIVSLYRTLIPEIVLGKSIWEGSRICHALDRAIVNNHCAKASFDMALADLVARRQAIGLNQLFGGWTDRQTVLQLIGSGTPELVSEMCLRARAEHGITSFKIKVGSGVDADRVMLERVRHILPDAFLCVDANSAYDAIDALRLLRSVPDLDIAWIEEPVPADQPLGRAQVVAAGFQVLGDESTTTPGEVAREVLGGRTTMVTLKTARTGYLWSNRIRGFCESTGTPIFVGTQGETGLGTLAGLVYTTAHASTSQKPAAVALFLNLEDDLLAEPLRVFDGMLAIRPGAGNGAELDAAKLDFYRIDA